MMSAVILALLITCFTPIRSLSAAKLNRDNLGNSSSGSNCNFYDLNIFYVICRTYHDELGAEVDEIIKVALHLINESRMNINL